MRPEKLSEAIGMLPDEIIEEMDAVRRNVRGSMKRKRRHRIYSSCMSGNLDLRFLYLGWKEGRKNRTFGFTTNISRE